MKDNPLKTEFFPYGTQYYRAPTPLPEEWDTDLRELARLGYTHIQYRPQWRSHERIYDSFTWDDLDRLFELAQRHRLRVVLKPLLECAPDWVFTELEGSRVGFSGVRIPPIAHGAFYVGGWLPCFDNPQVAERAAEFTFQCASRYRNHPALWFYDAWNEPRSRPAGQCHCHHSAESYQQWLKNRFGSVEELNRQFGKAWSTFDTVMPPESAADYAEMFLWRQWAAWAVSEHVRNVADAIRRAAPGAVVLNHIGCASVVADSVCDSSDDLLNASTTDFYGTSFPVPLRPATVTESHEGDLIGDWLRRVDPGFWIHEFYPSHGNWSRPCRGDMLRFLVWQGISTGTSGFTYWQYRSERVGNETNGYGLREINGSSTERSAAADRIAGILKEHGAILAGTRRAPSPLALLYDKSSDLISRIQCFNQAQMLDESNDTALDFYKPSLRAAHVLYDRLPEGIDFVTADDDLRSRRCLVVTATEIVSAAFAARLREFVHNGGTLIVEYPFAVRDDNTWVAIDRPQPEMAELCGFREKIRWEIAGETARIDGEALGNQRWYCIGEVAADAVVFGRWSTGEAAAIRREAGKGSVITLLASPSLAYANGETVAPVQITGKLLESCFGPRLLPFGLSVRERRSDRHKVRFLFHTGTEAPIEWERPSGTVWDAVGYEELPSGKIRLAPHGFAIIAD